MQETDLSKAIPTIVGGDIAVIPTDTIYGIVAQATNPSAVQKIYDVKQRNPSKPFIILISSLDDLKLFEIPLSKTVNDLLDTYWPGPVSIILDCPNPQFEYLHRGTDALAFRLPQNEKIRQLIKVTGPLVAPSANPEGLPTATNISEAKAYFDGRITCYIEGDVNTNPSKIIRITGDGSEEIIRA